MYLTKIETMFLIQYFFWLICIDNIYQAMWYFKCRLYRQNIEEGFRKRFRATTERYLYYFLLSIINIHLQMIFFNQEIRFTTWLTWLDVTDLVCEHYLFQRLYSRMLHVFKKMLHGTICIVLVKIFNFLGQHLIETEPDKNYINYHDIILIWTNLDYHSCISIVKFIIQGVLYDFFYQYGIFIFAESSEATKKQYTKELILAIESRNVNFLMSPSTIPKLFVVYNEIENGWLMKKIKEIKYICKTKMLQITSYWYCIAFIIDLYPSSMVINIIWTRVLLILLIWKIEISGRQTLSIHQFFIYGCFLCLFIDASSSLLTIALLHPPYYIIDQIDFVFIWKKIHVAVNLKDLSMVGILSIVWSCVFLVIYSRQDVQLLIYHVPVLFLLFNVYVLMYRFYKLDYFNLLTTRLLKILGFYLDFAEENTDECDKKIIKVTSTTSNDTIQITKVLDFEEEMKIIESDDL